MSAQGLGFITHLELEGLLGGGQRGAQQRRRLTERGYLPQPRWLRADRERLAIFPEFVLGGLVIGARAPRQHQALVSKAVAHCEQLCSNESFATLAEALTAALREVSADDAVSLSAWLVGQASVPLRRWRDEVADIGALLAANDLRLEVLVARVIGEEPDAYTVQAPGGGDPERHPREDAPTALASGAWVTRDRVSVGSAARDFLLPIPDIEELTGMDLHQLFGEPEDDSVESLIRELNVELRSVPRPAVSRAYSEPRTQPEPAFDIDIPLDLIVDANPMVR